MGEDKPLTGDDRDQGSAASDISAQAEKQHEEEPAEYLADGKLVDGELDDLMSRLEALESFPEDERDRRMKDLLVAFKRQVVEIESTEGPIPPPKMLAGYEAALPGSANRIISMAESQQAHRHEIESAVIRGGIVSERVGAVFGGVIAILSIIGTVFLIAIGKSAEGLALVAAEAATIAAVFLKTNKDGKRELEAKRGQADSNTITNA